MHAGCLQLSHRRPPQMYGLRTRPRTDVGRRDSWIHDGLIGGEMICHCRTVIGAPPPGRYDTLFLAVTVHQCLNGRTPPYLSEHCISVSSADTRRHLRPANRHLLAVPRFRLNAYGRRAFSVAGPMSWNSLPDFIRDPTSSTDCFN